MSKAQKFCNLHTFVKKENSGLYDLLEDMCAVGLFRPKYPTTFINPSKEVVAKLKSLVDKGESDVAFEHLQKHFIYGKHTSLTGELINYNSKVVKTKLSEVTQKMDKLSLWKSRDDNVAVFQQTSADFLEEGAKKARPLTDKKKVGKITSGSEPSRVEATKELLNKSKDDNVMHVFARAVNGILLELQKQSEDDYKSVLTKLDPNPVLCWYILIKPCANCNSDNCAKHVPDSVFDEWYKKRDVDFNKKSTAVLREAFSSNDFDNSLIAKAKQARSNVDMVGFKQTRDSIIATYDEDFLTLLEDELRFRFSDLPASNFSHDSANISELNGVNWDQPEESLVLLKDSSSLLNSVLHKVMQEFVISNAFHYTMFNDSVHQKLENNIVGAGSGANKVVKILGKEGRKLIKSMEDADEEEELGKFVSSLTKSQLSSLKKILKSL